MSIKIHLPNKRKNYWGNDGVWVYRGSRWGYRHECGCVTTIVIPLTETSLLNGGLRIRRQKYFRRLRDKAGQEGIHNISCYLNKDRVKKRFPHWPDEQIKKINILSKQIREASEINKDGDRTFFDCLDWEDEIFTSLDQPTKYIGVAEHETEFSIGQWTHSYDCCDDETCDDGWFKIIGTWDFQTKQQRDRFIFELQLCYLRKKQAL